MPSVSENLKLWSEHHWSHAGEEWAVGYADNDTANADIAWSVGIWPRIHRCLPAAHILEIGPGFGAWTQFLRQWSRHMTLVDLTPRCIDECRKRFGSLGMTYHVNDGRSLEMVADDSVDFVFSWHSLVHCQHDVMTGYVRQLARKLKPGCWGMIQHSNFGMYFNPVRGAFERENPAGFGEDMTAAKFASDAFAAGLTVDVQEIAPWGSHDEISCFSLFHRPAPPELVRAAPQPVRNLRFWEEVRSRAEVERLYGRPGIVHRRRGLIRRLLGG